MIHSESITQIAEALAKAQAEFPKLPKDKVAKIDTKAGGQYSYRYADLASILEAIREPMAKHKLAIVQPVESGQGSVKVTTVILHGSGEYLGCEVTIPYQGDVKALGSAITYARRYGLTSMLGLAADEDDDATAAAKSQPARESRKSAPAPSRAPAQEAKPAAKQAEQPAPEAEESGAGAEKRGEVVAVIRAQEEQGLREADRELALAVCSSIIGRDIRSRKELSFDEARHVLKVLRAVTAAGSRRKITHFADFWRAYIGGALKEGLSILEPNDISKLIEDYLDAKRVEAA